jgi:hypothetical protein
MHGPQNVEFGIILFKKKKKKCVLGLSQSIQPNETVNILHFYQFEGLRMATTVKTAAEHSVMITDLNN